MDRKVSFDTARATDASIGVRFPSELNRSLMGDIAPVSERFRAREAITRNWSLSSLRKLVEAARDVISRHVTASDDNSTGIGKKQHSLVEVSLFLSVGDSDEFCSGEETFAIRICSTQTLATQGRTKAMKSRSIAHRFLRTALAFAVLTQTAFVMPAGACGANGSCCSETSACQDSEGCCFRTTDRQSEAPGRSCCYSADTFESSDEVRSCCHSTESSPSPCTCQCGQPIPRPAAPPANSDAQVRLIPVCADMATAAVPAQATAVSTGWSDRQSSLLKTAPRSVQVLFCTWLT